MLEKSKNKTIHVLQVIAMPNALKYIMSLFHVSKAREGQIYGFSSNVYMPKCI